MFIVVMVSQRDFILHGIAVMGHFLSQREQHNSIHVIKIGSTMFLVWELDSISLLLWDFQSPIAVTG